MHTLLYSRGLSLKIFKSFCKSCAGKDVMTIMQTSIIVVAVYTSLVLNGFTSRKTIRSSSSHRETASSRVGIRSLEKSKK